MAAWRRTVQSRMRGAASKAGAYIFVLGLAWAAGVAAAAAAAAPRLNVVLISMDTVRADHLSCYGYSRPTTPNLDRLAQEGVIFTRAFAQAPTTLPSHLSIFTSRYPEPSWVFWEDGNLPESTVSLTAALRQNGYASAASTFFVSEAMRRLLKSEPFRQFDFSTTGRLLMNLPDEEIWKWLEAHAEGPFFLFMHGFDAHEPHVLPAARLPKRFDPAYEGRMLSTMEELEALRQAGPIRPMEQIPPDERLGRAEYEIYMERLTEGGPPKPRDLEHVLAVYDAQLRALDEGLGVLFGRLEELGLMDRTVIVVFSDHGQEFGEHGRYAEHGRCYEEAAHIALIVRDPRGKRRAAVSDALVESIDVMPTILELVELPIPASAQGRSLLPLMREGADPGRDAIAVTAGMSTRAARTPEWSFLLNRDGAEELYRLIEDPQEQHNVAARHPEAAQNLRVYLDERLPKRESDPNMDFRQWTQDNSYW